MTKNNLPFTKTDGGIVISLEELNEDTISNEQRKAFYEDVLLERNTPVLFYADDYTGDVLILDNQLKATKNET